MCPTHVQALRVVLHCKILKVTGCCRTGQVCGRTVCWSQLHNHGYMPDCMIPGLAHRSGRVLEHSIGDAVSVYDKDRWKEGNHLFKPYRYYRDSSALAIGSVSMLVYAIRPGL